MPGPILNELKLGFFRSSYLPPGKLNPRYYSVNYNNPAGGWNYYRLKETDKDGKFYLSLIVSTKFDEPKGFEIYPNPVEDYAYVHTDRGQTWKYMYMI
jgi:hypothetical protein